MGSNALVARRFRRSDGIVGVGFYIQYAGLTQASVSWPDREAQRYTEDQFKLGALTDAGEVNWPMIGATAEEMASLRSQKDAVEMSLKQSAVENEKLAKKIEELLSDSQKNESVSEPESVQAEGLSEAEAETILEAAEELPAEEPAVETTEVVEEPKKSEAQHIRDYLAANPDASNSQVIEHLATISVNVTSSQVATQRRRVAKE